MTPQLQKVYNVCKQLKTFSLREVVCDTKLNLTSVSARLNELVMAEKIKKDHKERFYFNDRLIKAWIYKVIKHENK